MRNLPDWLTVIIVPPALVGLWFIEDVQALRILAFIWGLNTLWDSIGWVVGAVGFVRRGDT